MSAPTHRIPRTPSAHVFALGTAAQLAATKCAAQPGAQPARDAWCIEWEDKGVDDDFNDAVVRIERLGPGSGVDVPGAQAFMPVINGDLSADPVNLVNGSYVYTRTDLAIPGRGPSPAFARAYNSGDPRANGLGPGWTHSYGMRLGAAADASGALVLAGPRGRTDRYTRQADGTYTPPPGVLTTLTQQADGTFLARHPDQSTWSFDGGGRLTALTDRYGNRSTLRYNTAGQLTAVDDPAGRGSLSFGYDPTSRALTSVTDWAGRQVRYGYDAQGRLQTVTDRENQTTRYGYDGPSARLATITDALGRVAVTNTYDAQGRVAAQQDARGLTTGQRTTFVYVANADGTRTTRVTYPPNAFDGSAQTTESTFDATGWLVRRVARPAAGETRTALFAYDGDGKRTSVTDARGATSRFCYDVGYDGLPIAGSRGTLTRVIRPAPASGGTPLVSLLRYDSRNNVTQTLSPKGVANGTTVDCSTNLTGAVNSLYATDLGYDAAGVELRSVTQRFTDPELGPRTAVTTVEYDAANPGLPSRVVPPRGNTGPSPDASFATTYTYGTGPSAGLLASVTDALGNTVTYGYDAMGRRTSLVDPLGNAAGANPAEHTWTWSYDAEDRLRFARTPAPTAGGAPLVAEQRYDAVGNRVVAVDTNGQVTRYVYDERDSLAEVQESPSAWTDPLVVPADVVRTAYQYDALGNLSRVTRAAGDPANERVTDYASDSVGQLRTETQYPLWPDATDTLVTRTTYDPNGNRVSLKQPDITSPTITQRYDALNRLTDVLYNDFGATGDVQYAYDANGNRARMRDGTGTTDYTYDERDRLLSVTSPPPGWFEPAPTVSQRYDLDGQRRALTYPDGKRVTYTFDRAGRLASLSDWLSRTTSYAYSPDGALERVSHLNGSNTTYRRDRARRLTEVWNQQAGSTISRHTATLDAAGQRTRMEEVLPVLGAPGPETPDRQWATSYGYDALQRLTGVTEPGGTTAFTYDPLGNRRTRTRGAVTTSYRYDRADRIERGAISYQVDDNGNVTNGPGAYTYDQANRLTSVADRDSATYDLDGDGKRVGRSLSGSPRTSYVYDPAGSLPRVLTDGERTYVWGAQGLAYLVERSGAIAVYHPDGLGSVRALTDAQGQVVQTYRYEAFGAPASVAGPSPQPFRFAGEPLDAETGFLYLRARSYDPETGRFVQADPLRKSGPGVGGWNRYAYVGNNPVNRTDPSGLLTYFVGGIGASPPVDQWDLFVSALRDANIEAVMAPVYAYSGAFFPDLGEVWLRNQLPAEDDPTAQRLKAQVLEDRLRYGTPGQQINFIAYSGGATSAFNAAELLGRRGIRVDNLVTIGGWVWRARPQNALRWTRIVGALDPAIAWGLPDWSVPPLKGTTHVNYWDDANQLIQWIKLAGVR